MINGTRTKKCLNGKKERLSIPFLGSNFFKFLCLLGTQKLKGIEPREGVGKSFFPLYLKCFVYAFVVKQKLQSDE